MNDHLKWAASDRYPLLKELSRKNRINPTDAEMLLWQQLRERSLNTKFFRQYIIADYIVDFVSLEKKLIIEVDGAYHSELEQQEYDEGRTERLQSFGFQVLRFSNEEVQNSIGNVIKIIQSYLHERL